MDKVHLTMLDLSCLDRNMHASVVHLVLLCRGGVMCNSFSMVVCCVLTFSLAEARRWQVVAHAFK